MHVRAPRPVTALAAAAAVVVGAAAGSDAAYGSWAHSHFVWLSSDPAPSFPAALTALVAGYRQRNISVGAVDIDSGWATGYNSFVPITSAFPDWHGFIADLKATFNVRVILWMTSMIDHDSPNFAEALANSYFVLDGLNRPAANLSWWHGVGGLLDYTNPAARSWWEAQMAPVLRGNGTAGTNIDGWKCDGTDPYIIELLDPRGAGGVPLTFGAYSNWYYGHTLNFSRSIVPDALIWSRPVDSWPIAFNLSAFLEYSPKYVMASGWVGDQDPTFEGLKDALINMFVSAWRGYANYGSDTGGYRTGDRSRELFCRWAQLNAFLPLFENGGNGDHTPWHFDVDGTTDVTDMYRELVAAHYALAPYFYATGVDALARGVAVMAPTVLPPKDFPFIIEPNEVAAWSFMVGASYFVHPVTDAGVTSVDVALPGASVSPAGWADFWEPARTYAPGATVTGYPVPLAGGAMRLPVFVAAHALLPLHASSSALPLFPAYAGPAWAPALTLLAVLTAAEQAEAAGGVAARLANGTARLAGAVLGDAPGGAPFSATLSFSASELTLAHAPLGRPLILLVHLPPGGGCAARALQGVRSVAWVRGGAAAAAGAGAGEVFVEQQQPQQPAVRDTRALALFWDDEATARAPALAAQYAQRLAGSFVRRDATLAVFLSAAQAAAGGELRVALE